MQRFLERIFFLVFFIFLFSCTKDKLMFEAGECVDEITFNNQIIPILDMNCSYSGCHDGSGSAPGNFTTYEGMAPFLNPTKFENRVIDQRDMPPAYATGPTSLTIEQIQTLICWVENNYSQ